ncbi:MAG: helix-turn-helix transcriptional regulator [Halioglobus sp.]
MAARRGAQPSSDLLYLLYRASLDWANLDDFLERAAIESGSHNVCIAIQDGRDAGCSRIIANRAGREVAKLYPDVADENPYIDTCRDYYQPGRVLRANTVLDDKTLLNSRFYDEYARKADIHHAMGINLRADDGVLVGMSFNRARRQPFTDYDQHWAEQLAPHLQTFFTTSERLAISSMSGDAAWAVLDMQRYGIQVYNDQRRPVFANRALQQLVENSADMRWRHDHLEASSPELSGWIAHCSRILQKSGSAADPMTYVLSHGAERYQFMFTPLVMQDGYRERTFSVLIVTDLNDKTSAVGEQLKAAYQLTPRESEVAMLLVQGLSTHEIAERLGVAESTVISHKKNLFQKTDVHRQSDLVRLALSFDIRN